MADWPLSEEEATGLPVDALGIRLLKQVYGDKTTLNNVVANLRARSDVIQQRAVRGSGTVVGTSGAALSEHYELAIGEAWHWLIANGLLTEIPMEAGWFVVSRLGRKILEEIPDPVSHVRAERRIAVDLHPLIRERVRSQFLLGEYDAAVLITMRAVEERVRELVGGSNSEIGVKLMKRAFGEDGPLRDDEMDGGEAASQMALFWGAIGFFKNPASHRQVHYESATEASEVVMLGDLLLRILDRIEAADSASP